MDEEEDFDNAIPNEIRKKWIKSLKTVYIEKQNYSKLKLQIKLEDILEYCKKLEQFIHENSFKLIINNYNKFFILLL